MNFKNILTLLLVVAGSVWIIVGTKHLERRAYNSGYANGSADTREHFARLLMPMGETKYDLPDTIRPGNHLMWDTSPDTAYVVWDTCKSIEVPWDTDEATMDSIAVAHGWVPWSPTD